MYCLFDRLIRLEDHTNEDAGLSPKAQFLSSYHPQIKAYVLTLPNLKHFFVPLTRKLAHRLLAADSGLPPNAVFSNS